MTVLNWQKSFPYKEVRQIQKEALQLLEDNWNKYDVFVIQAPTAFGKSAVAKTIMNSCYSVSYITPTNLLVDQFLAEFPDTACLHRLDSYHCEEWMRPCSVTRARKQGFCKGCPASKALGTAKYKKGPGAYNYYTYTAHKLYRDVLVVDEAHNLIPHIREKMGLRIWQHDYGYPSNAFSNQQLLDWFQKLPKNKQEHKKMSILRAALTSQKPEYVVSRATREYNGKGTVRGEPEDRDCIELLPVDISRAPKMFWPKQVKKTILLSATLEERDIRSLGMDGRICYIKCKSPISQDRRPIIIDPVISVNWRNLEESAEKMAKYIEELAGRKPGEKGVIHATYKMSVLIKKYLQSGTDPNRYIFHTNLDKKQQYQKFLKSPASEGKILIACGMYEGIDLPRDLGRWQVISKIPWMSLVNPAIKYQADTDPEWYLWETLRTMIQACGRICRTPEDHGETYILDASFDKLFSQAQHLMPEWYLEALVDINNYTGIPEQYK